MSESIRQTTGDLSASAVEAPGYRQRQTLGQLLRGDLGFIPVLLTLVAVAIYFTITTNGLFLTPINLSNLMQQIVTIGIGGIGITLVLLLGEIDLSVASVATLSAVVMGVLSERLHVPPMVAIAAAILTGALAGCINGLFTALLRIPSFIVTLASSISFAGLLLYLLAGQSTLIVHDPLIVSISGSPFSFLPDAIGVGLPTLVLALYVAGLIFTQWQRRQTGLRVQPTLQLVVQIVIAVILVEGTLAVLQNTPAPTPGLFLGVPNGVAVLFGLLLLVWLLLTKTRFGRYIYAVGGNMEAARRAGINVTYVKIAAFTLCSVLAAISGVLAASRANAVASQIDPTLQLHIIAAAVIGGVSLFGGRGSVWSVVLGSLIIGGLGNGLDLRSQGSDVKQMVEGSVLVLAVAIDALIRRAQARSSSGR